MSNHQSVLIEPRLTAGAERHGPACLTDCQPTRTISKTGVTPLSRPPATGRLGEVFHLAAQRNSDQTFRFDRPPDILPNGSTRYSGGAWAALVDEVAAGFVQAGIEPWDRVVIFKRNHFDITALESAAARIGAVAVPLAESLPPETVRSFLQRLDGPVLITDLYCLDGSDLRPADLAQLTRQTIVIGEQDCYASTRRFEDLFGAAPVSPALRAEHEPMFISHTSGTTGMSKLVAHSADSIRAQSHIETERWPFIGLRRSDRVAFCDPFFHTRVHTAVIALATIGPDILALSTPDPAVVAPLLHDFGPTVVEALPNIYLTWEDMAAARPSPLRSVRLYISSFDAIHTRTVRTMLRASERKCPVWIQSWSQSENGALAVRPYLRRSVAVVGKTPSVTQNLGWPQPLIGKLRAVDPNTGRPVGRGREGLIQASLPGRCLGYVGEQDRYDRKIDGRWWHTGEIGVVNRDDSVRLIDREIDRIDSASCIAVEDVLLDRLPQATELVVLSAAGGLPQPVVSTRDDLPINPADWRSATADLPALADPITVEWRQFPRTPTWKIRRNELREQLLGVNPIGQGHWT